MTRFPYLVCKARHVIPQTCIFVLVCNQCMCTLCNKPLLKFQMSNWLKLVTTVILVNSFSI